VGEKSLPPCLGQKKHKVGKTKRKGNQAKNEEKVIHLSKRRTPIWTQSTRDKLQKH
jgi:hypothetical protein